ncbi:LD-carboxypeptidase [bacterium]|nr:LD-carboxypeptidase [bacterium]
MAPQSILYPGPLRKGDAIGVTASSSGVSAPSHIQRLELIELQLRDEGFEVIEGRCLRQDHKHVSGTPKERAADFMNLWNNPKVKAIIPPWGGELLIGILPELDFGKLRANPKWVLGYSDTSTLLFAITTCTGIATAHGSNLMDLIKNQIDDIHRTAIRALGAEKGFSFSQRSFTKFQVEFISFEQQLDALYNATEPVEWKILGTSKDAKISGRLIGGCMDTLVHLVGTPYGDLPSFVSKHSQDGTILYLENCELTPCNFARSLWQMRLAGWFRGLSGMVFGRSNAKDATSPTSLSYVEALESVLGELDIPIVFDADFGHRPPQMLFVNGALAEIQCSNGKAKVAQKFV